MSLVGRKGRQSLRPFCEIKADAFVAAMLALLAMFALPEMRVLFRRKWVGGAD